AVGRFFVALFALFALVLLASPARAGGPGDGFPIVQSGREADIRALVVPHALLKEVRPGWTLAGIAIGATTIRFVVKGPGETTATLRLEHPDRAPSKERSASFALHRESHAEAGVEPPPLDVLDSLVLAILHNDKGNFWPAAKPIAPAENKPAGAGTGQGSLKVEERSARWELTLRRKLLLGGLGAALILLLVDRLRLRAKVG
ncbi:MAG: hypothetical protein ABI193_16610, partial [Minicystis sp.]